MKLLTRAMSVLLLMLAAAAPPATQPTPNDTVLNVARAYKNGGGYNTKWAGTGTPEQIDFNGERILRKGTDGTYCCGFTFAVVMKAAAQLNLLEGKSPDDIRKFQKEWYGAVKDETIRELQCTTALEHLGIGKPVSQDEAKAGDFCQLYRAKGGHSVIFLNWVEKDGKRIGFRYRSSQESTKGIGDRTEYFVDSGREDGKVIRSRVYFGRLNATPHQ